MISSRSLTLDTLYADLKQKSFDAAFAEFPENGSFERRSHNGRDYFYYRGYSEGRRRAVYVGPAKDPEIIKRIEDFHRLKIAFKERRELVRILVREGYPPPVAFVGDLLEALARAGLFRLRVVIVGTVAFQCYGSELGVTLPRAQQTTQDLDLAQFHSVSVLVDDQAPSISDALVSVDPTFQPVPHQGDRASSTTFHNATGFRVEFLTPNTGSDEHEGRPARIPALTGIGAQPLRFLDFLIYGAQRAVVLHKGGVLVNIPAPERFAIHKLIVSERRADFEESRTKARKDLTQAALLIEALHQRRLQRDLADAWIEAWKRGPAWREALRRARSKLDPEIDRALRVAIQEVSDAEGMNTSEM